MVVEELLLHICPAERVAIHAGSRVEARRARERTREFDDGVVPGHAQVARSSDLRSEDLERGEPSPGHHQSHIIKPSHPP